MYQCHSTKPIEDTPLFDAPAHHKSDPETSEIAEAKITKSGKRTTHCMQVLAGLARNDGVTNGELADIIEMKYIDVVRRMSDLKDKGLARVGFKKYCAINRTLCVTHFITEKGRKVLDAKSN